MLFEAFFWDPAASRPEFEVFRQDPGFRKLLAEWGRHGDQAVVAEVNRSKVGAAWFRLWTPERHSYGFIDANTPEIGMAVIRSHRRREKKKKKDIDRHCTRRRVSGGSPERQSMQPSPALVRIIGFPTGRRIGNFLVTVFATPIDGFHDLPNNSLHRTALCAGSYADFSASPCERRGSGSAGHRGRDGPPGAR